MYTPVFIPSWSNDPFNYKAATFRSLLQRLHMHCSNDSSKLAEYNTIVNQAILHGYDEFFISNINRSIISNNCNNNTAPGGSQQPDLAFLHPVRYHPAIRPIGNALLKHNKSLPFACLNTMFHTLMNTKPSLPSFKRAGTFTTMTVTDINYM